MRIAAPSSPAFRSSRRAGDAHFGKTGLHPRPGPRYGVRAGRRAGPRQRRHADRRAAAAEDPNSPTRPVDPVASSKATTLTEELFRADHYLPRCDATVTQADEAGVRLDRTVFYVTGGGQPGDSGVLAMPDGRRLRIADTRKGGAPGEILHIPDAGQALPRAGERVSAEIDWPRRYRHMRIHTALHLLSAVIPAPVSGGQVGDGKGRLDFDTQTALDKDEIAARLNALVAEDHPVGVRWITDDELAAKPELVRTMSVKPPTGLGRVRLLEIEGVDLQPCGGTHVARTGEIGRLVVTKIESKGARNRRVAIAFAE